MKSKIAERILNSTPKDVEIYVRLYADLVVRITDILKEKQMTQKALAENLGKQPSEIHKWLSGDHNFTLRSLAKLQAELGEEIIYIPQKVIYTHYIEGGVKTMHMTVVKNSAKPSIDTLYIESTPQPLADVI